jgi:polar amino acid transport system permease protein
MPTVLIGSLPYLLQAAVNTVWMSLISVTLGTILGVAAGILSVLAPRVVRGLITAYVFVFRGVPVLVLMFLAYFALPAFGLRINVFVAVGGALVLYTGAFVAEITRGAILAIPRGQVDAAKSLGMRWGLIMRQIILPQALRMSVPPLLNNSVIMVKATSYASIVGVWELTYAAREVVERSLAAFQVFLGVMAIYFVICYPLSVLARRLEKRFAFVQ